jgi:hypothetical protein
MAAGFVWGFDESIVSEGNRRVYVKPGDYLTEVVSAKPCREEHVIKDGVPTGKSAYIIFGLKLVKGPDGLGKILNHTATLKPTAQFGLGNFLVWVGKKELQEVLKGKGGNTYEGFAKIVAALEKKLSGCPIGIQVVDQDMESSNGREFTASDIAELYPAEEYEDRAAVTATVGEEVDLDGEEEEVEQPRRGRGRPRKGTAPAAAPKAQAAPAESDAEDLDAELDAML